MANQRSWWTLVISREPHGPHDPAIELSDADREYIASLIADEFTEGEITQDSPGEPASDDRDLVWESAGTSEPRDQKADSVHRVAGGATSAHYSLGPVFAAPSQDGEQWGLELVQVNNGVEIYRIDLGQYSDERTTKEHARRWEFHDIYPPVGKPTTSQAGAPPAEGNEAG